MYWERSENKLFSLLQRGHEVLWYFVRIVCTVVADHIGLQFFFFVFQSAHARIKFVNHKHVEHRRKNTFVSSFQSYMKRHRSNNIVFRLGSNLVRSSPLRVCCFQLFKVNVHSTTTLRKRRRSRDEKVRHGCRHFLICPVQYFPRYPSIKEHQNM